LATIVVLVNDLTVSLTPSSVTVGATKVEYCDPVMVRVGGVAVRFAVALAIKGIGLN
jgi:hypothetical protein